MKAFMKPDKAEKKMREMSTAPKGGKKMRSQSEITSKLYGEKTGQSLITKIGSNVSEGNK